MPASTSAATVSAEFTNGILKCRKTEARTTASICPIQAPIDHHPIGADCCSRPGVKIEALWTGDTILEVPGSVARVIAQTLPGDNQGWVLDRDGATGDHDRFTRTRVSFVYPENQNLATILQQAQRQNSFQVLPEYDIRGSISQLDDDVEKRTC